MRFLQIPGILDPNLRVRRLTCALRGNEPILGILIGDRFATCSVHWIRLTDGSEPARRTIPVFSSAPDPALSPNLERLAYLEEADSLSLVLEQPLDPSGPRGTIPFPRGMWEDEETRSCRCLAFSRSGELLRASLSDGDLLTFSVQEIGKELRISLVDQVSETVPPATVILHGNAEHFQRVTGRQEPTELSVIAGDNTVGHLLVNQSEPVVFELGNQVVPRAGTLSSDGQWLALATDSRVLVWSISGWHLQQPFSLPDHSGAIHALAFAPDTGTLATAGEDGAVYLWDVASQSLLSRRPLSLGSIGGLAFSPDGQFCIAGGERGRIAIWNLAEAIEQNPPAFSARQVPSAISAPVIPQTAPPEAEASAAEAETEEIGPTWVPVEGMEIPGDAVVAGHEADGVPLYAARAAYKGGIYLGKVRYGFGGANLGYRRREVAVQPFEVLVGSAVWVSARGGEIPAEAIPCGQDDKGNPFYLARGAIGEGLHPGRIAPGMSAARIPYGGAEIDVSDYEVMIRDTLSEEETSEDSARSTVDLSREPLLYWDFANTASERGISIAVGISSAPRCISGFISQTGGGPAEHWSEHGTVFLIRHLGTNDLYLWITLTAPLILEGVTFRHWHNHNPGYPTCPSYQVQLQIDEGAGDVDLGEPLLLSNETSGRTDSIWVGRHLRPGNYRLRWRPRGLHRGRDTSSEFFALKNLRLDGRFVQE